MLGSLWVLSALSSVVFVEPAPYDLLLMSFLALGLLTNALRFPRFLLLPSALLFVFVLSNLITVPVSENLSDALFYVAVTLYLVLSWVFFVGVVSVVGQAALDAIFSGYVAASLFAVATGTAAFFGFAPSLADRLLLYGRVTAFFKDPNVFGPFLVVGVLYTLLRVETEKGYRRMGWISLFGFLSFGVLLSFSRAAWGNYVLTVPLYVLAVGGADLRRKFRVLLPLLVALALALLYVVGNADITTMLAERFGFQYYDQDRFQTQAAALGEAARNPLGIGPGQSETFFAYATHSLYLRVLIENGWLGFLAFAAFVVLTLHRSVVMAFRTRGLSRHYHTLFAIAITGVLFNSFFIDSLHWRHFWLLLALPWIPFETSLHHHQS